MLMSQWVIIGLFLLSILLNVDLLFIVSDCGLTVAVDFCKA